MKKAEVLPCAEHIKQINNSLFHLFPYVYPRYERRKTVKELIAPQRALSSVAMFSYSNTQSKKKQNKNHAKFHSRLFMRSANSCRCRTEFTTTTTKKNEIKATSSDIIDELSQ